MALLPIGHVLCCVHRGFDARRFSVRERIAVDSGRCLGVDVAAWRAVCCDSRAVAMVLCADEDNSLELILRSSVSGADQSDDSTLSRAECWRSGLVENVYHNLDVVGVMYLGCAFDSASRS